MRYWRVIFDVRELDNQTGWLELNDVDNTNCLREDDGTVITEGISYTTTDTNPTPPTWGT